MRTSEYKVVLVGVLVSIGWVTQASANSACSGEKQITIPRVEQMPAVPVPYKMRDWKKVARDYDRFVFDFTKTGQYLPLIWTDNTGPYEGFGLPSYVGHPKMTGDNQHEAINCVGAVISGTYAGVDKSIDQGKNWVLMCRNYFSPSEGIYLNGKGASSGGTFWYELFPNVAMFQLTALYPQFPELEQNMKTAADSWSLACAALKRSPDTVPDFRCTAFDFKSKKPVKNGKWIEPDAAAAVAWLELMAHAKFGQEDYLQTALSSLDFLQQETANPAYELLMPYGVYAAARINAEQGYDYDVEKFLNWCFEASDARWGWGVIVGRWGDYDCSGLVGSLTDGGGYGFAMNTFVMAGQLVPMTRYDQRFARAVGKWMLNAANASRLLYADGLPPAHQTCWEWANQYDKDFCLTYEGLRKEWKGKSPFAMGDPLVHHWANTDFALYGSSWCGLMAALITPTNVEGVLQLDCLATDYFRADAFPTFLYYNPYSQAKHITISMDAQTHRLYDAVRNDFIYIDKEGDAAFKLEADTAVVVVVVPVSGRIRYDGGKTFCDDIVIDFDNGRPSPARQRRNILKMPDDSEPDSSKVLTASKASIMIDGFAQEWASLGGDRLLMDSGHPDRLTCLVRFAWDENHLYLLVEEQKSRVNPQEAADGGVYEPSPWSFDGVSFYLDVDNSSNAEAVGDMNVWLGFSSEGRSDLYCARSHHPQPLSRTLLSRSRVATAGNAADHSRTIEAAIHWQDIAEAVSVFRQPGRNLVKAIKSGFRFGCETLVISNDYQHQYYLGGPNQPSGRDLHSCDILLTE